MGRQPTPNQVPTLGSLIRVARNGTLSFRSLGLDDCVIRPTFGSLLEHESSHRLTCAACFPARFGLYASIPVLLCTRHYREEGSGVRYQAAASPSSWSMLAWAIRGKHCSTAALQPLDAVLSHNLAPSLSIDQMHLHKRRCPVRHWLIIGDNRACLPLFALKQDRAVCTDL
jgi:hypothetical protein